MDLDTKDVLSKTDIVELIGEVVDLHPRKGKNGEMIGLCPFHQDSTPSFEVNASKGVYSCWSCSAGLGQSRGGSALTFVQRYHEMSFVEALTYLARRAGIYVPYPSSAKVSQALNSVDDPAVLARRQAISTAAKDAPKSAFSEGEPNPLADKGLVYDALKTAEDYYHAALLAHPEALNYVQSVRGINTEIIKKYGIGYAPKSFTNLNVAYSQQWLGDHPRVLIDAGLSRLNKEKGRQYDFFRDRIMFPVRNVQGKTSGFGARRRSDTEVIDKNGEKLKIPKYLNSPETAVFSKSDSLFGFSEARHAIEQQRHVILVEGYMDVLGLASRGISNCVAVMGVALSDSHIAQIKEVTEELIICMDPDSAGHAAAMRAIASLAAHITPVALNSEELKARTFTVRFAHLPQLSQDSSVKGDPDEFVRQHGKDAFEKIVQIAQPLHDFWNESWMKLFQAADAKQKFELARDARMILHSIKDQMLDTSLYQRMDNLIDSLAGPRPTKTKQIDVSGPTDLLEPRKFTSHEPSDRLRQSCMALPQQAKATRQELIALQKKVAPEVLPDAVLWMARFDQAIEAGLSAERPMTDAEKMNHQRIIGAASSIFSHFLEQVARERLHEQRCAGLVSDQEYLQRVERHLKCKV